MTPRLGSVIVTLVAIASLEAPHLSAAPSLCPGDTWANKGSATVPLDETTLQIRSSSRIGHTTEHPNCAHGGSSPAVGNSVELMGGFFTNCQTDIAQVGHEDTALTNRVCAGLSEGYYRARGSHYYNGAFDSYSYGNQRYVTGGSTGGGCIFNGCAAPGWTLNQARCRFPDVVDECGCCKRDLTPLVIDLSGNGMSLSSAANGALFELDGPGAAPVWVGWPLTTDDAWLFMDRTGDGTVSDGSEFFGSATPLSSGAIAEDGYEALGDLDANGDHWINALDPPFPDLRLWMDRNRNGVSEPRELIPLAAAGVLALSLDYSGTPYDDGNGNHFRYCAPVIVESGPGDGPSIERVSCDVYPDIATAVP